jgi:hypothetical protein
MIKEIVFDLQYKLPKGTSEQTIREHTIEHTDWLDGLNTCSEDYECFGCTLKPNHPSFHVACGELSDRLEVYAVWKGE